MLGRELRSWGYLNPLHNGELRSYPQVSKQILANEFWGTRFFGGKDQQQQLCFFRDVFCVFFKMFNIVELFLLSDRCVFDRQNQLNFMSGKCTKLSLDPSWEIDVLGPTTQYLGKHVTRNFPSNPWYFCWWI